MGRNAWGNTCLGANQSLLLFSCAELCFWLQNSWAGSLPWKGVGDYRISRNITDPGMVQLLCRVPDSFMGQITVMRTSTKMIYGKEEVALICKKKWWWKYTYTYQQPTSGNLCNISSFTWKTMEHNLLNSSCHQWGKSYKQKHLHFTWAASATDPCVHSSVRIWQVKFNWQGKQK